MKIIDAIREWFTAKPDLLGLVDDLHDEAHRQAEYAATRAAELRIESERLYHEAEVAQGEANRLETLARSLGEITGLYTDDTEELRFPDLNNIST